MDHLLILKIVDDILQQHKYCKPSEISIALTQGSTYWNPEATCGWRYILSKYPHIYKMMPGGQAVTWANWRCKDADSWRMLKESWQQR
jgi:hypothetical protein